MGEVGKLGRSVGSPYKKINNIVFIGEVRASAAHSNPSNLAHFG